jgi:ribosomal protein S18 acetylase RimI-like enzyme
MLIRPATINDAVALADVHVRTWQAAYADILPAGYLATLDPAARVEPWRQRLDGRVPPAETFVADHHGIITGFVSVGAFRYADDATSAGDAAEVYAIYVDPDSWSTGTGRALMSAAITHLAAARFREIFLWVFEENHRARSFYKRAGFAPDGTSVVDMTDRGGAYETRAVELRYRLLVD